MPVNDEMRVVDKHGKPLKNVFCIGDANGKYMLAHAASAQVSKQVFKLDSLGALLPSLAWYLIFEFLVRSITSTDRADGFKYFD